MVANLASEVRAEEENASVRTISASAVTVLAMLGLAERGPIGSSTLSNSFAEWEKQHGGYTEWNLDTVEAVRGFFDGGGTQLRFGRVVHTSVVGDPTTKTSAAATLALETDASAPSAGVVTSAVQPYNLEPGWTLVVSVDGGGDQTFTFLGTAPSRVSAAEPFALADGNQLALTVNGVAFTKTFNTGEFAAIGAATAEEIVASLNAFFAANDVGAVASVTGGGTTVTITNTRRGTGSTLNITGGTANVALAFTTGSLAGTGSAANIDAVTAAEAAALVSATITGAVAVAVGNALRITSSTTGGASSVQVKSSSTADTAMGFDNAVHSGSSGAAQTTLTVDGKTDGEYANELVLQVADATSGEADLFNLYITRNGVVRERYYNLSMSSAHLRYAPLILNDTLSGSDLVVLTDAAVGVRPANGTYGPMTGGDDGLVGLADTDYSGGETSSGSTGLRVFDADDIDLVIAPGRATAAVHNAMITYCEIHRSGLAFTILDPPKNYSASQMVTYVESTANLLELSDKAAIYWPNVRVANPDKALFGSEANVVIAPSGHLAGMYARTDARKTAGQFQQPAGVERGLLPGVLGLETNEVKKKPKRDLLFPKLINPISQERGTPLFVDGARTLKSSSPFPSVGQRRGIIHMEKQLIPGLAFMRHQNINEGLYERGRRSIQVFMLELTANDAFKSKDPKKAFFVDLGKGLNPASVQAQKTVRARIGVATSEPAEFIVLLVGPDTRALDEELAALAA